MHRHLSIKVGGSDDGGAAAMSPERMLGLLVGDREHS